MKIYVASSFGLLTRVAEVVAALEGAGHTITVKWWDRAFNIPGEGPVHTTKLKQMYASLEPRDFYSRPECKIAYETDRQGIIDADILVFVAGDVPRAYNGANVELGMADAWNKKCYSVGNLENSALYWKVTHCGDIPTLLARITPKCSKMDTCPIRKYHNKGYRCIEDESLCWWNR